MKTPIKFKLSITLAIFCASFISIFTSSSTFAEYIDVTPPETWKPRAALTGLEPCYKDTYLREQITGTLDIKNFKRAIITKKDANDPNSSSVGLSLYTWEGHRVGNCEQMIIGGEKTTGVFGAFGKSPETGSTEETNTLLINMGYTETKTSISSPETCTYFVYKFSFYKSGSRPDVEDLVRAYYITPSICVDGNKVTIKNYGDEKTKQNTDNLNSGKPKNGLMCPEAVGNQYPCYRDGNFYDQTVEYDSNVQTIKIFNFNVENDKIFSFKVLPTGGESKKIEYKGDWGEFTKEINQELNNSDSGACYRNEDEETKPCAIDAQNYSDDNSKTDYDIHLTYDGSFNNDGKGHSNIKETNKAYEIKDKKYNVAYIKAIKYLSDNTYTAKDQLKITQAEQLAFYLKALNQVLSENGKNAIKTYFECYTIDSDAAKSLLYTEESDYIKNYEGLGVPINVNFDGKYNPKTTGTNDKNEQISYCVIRKKSYNSHKDDTVRNWLTKDLYFNVWPNDDELSVKELIEKINELSKTVKEEDLAKAVSETGISYKTSNGNSTNGQSPGKVDPTCYNQGGAGSLGWIVCAILDWMQRATTGLYEDIVEPSLQVKPELFQSDSSGSNNGTIQGAEGAWRVFRDIANIVFTIIVLFVIFSQLTGVGIDNYGIKKILPKLIIAAVLINLSYLICLICVDLSNIIGNGIQDFFNSIQITNEQKLTSYGPKGIANDAGFVVIGVVAAAITVYSVVNNPALLLVLLISVLGVFISILFIFILLAGRKAAIILLTVVSPLAFILYMLPNTKKIFSKWFNLWKAMLLVYPICGLLIGGGNFASKLMLAVGDPSSAISMFTAMMVGIIPIFFIPTVIKGAYAAIGNIGSTISGFGNKMRGGATRRAKNSDAYKNLQERGKESGIRRKAGYDKNGNRKWDENGPNWRQRFLRGGKKNIARNALAYQKLQSEKGALKATEGADYMLATETANEAKRIVSSGEINTIGKIGQGKTLTDGLYRALMDNNRAKINAYSDALSAKGENGRKAVKEAYDRAVKKNMDSVAAKTLADNIMANHAADYKNNNRSMFNIAQGINSGSSPAMPIDSYVATHQSDLANKVTAATIGTMDEDAFDETFGIGRDADGKIMYGIPAGADAATIGEIAYKAMSTQNAGIKSDRMAKLKGVMEAAGYSGPGAQDVNVTNMPKTVAVPGAAEEGKTFDVRAMSDETLLDMATNPNTSNDDPTRIAAEQEYLRRNNGKV